jgi:hypothetical protein
MIYIQKSVIDAGLESGGGTAYRKIDDAQH